jgi:hypothetical protein
MTGRFALAAVAAFCLFFAACGGQVEAPAISAAEQKAQEATERLSASEGGKLVLRAINAHGGLDAWYEAPTTSFTWEYSNVGMNLRFKTRAVVDNQTRRAYHEFLLLGTQEGTEPYEGRFAWDGEQAWIYPADTPAVNPRFWALTGFYFQQIPFVLADPGLSYAVMPDEDLEGKTYDMVKASFGTGVGDSPGDTYTLYVDKETDMVAGIRYTVTYGRQPSGASDAPPPAETQFLFQDYASVDGLTVPTRFYGSNFANGAVVSFKNEAWGGEVSYSQPFDESKLEMPEGARIQPPPGQ